MIPNLVMLPNELLMYIFEFLDLKTLGRLEQVNSFFQGLILKSYRVYDRMQRNKIQKLMTFIPNFSCPEISSPPYFNPVYFYLQKYLISTLQTSSPISIHHASNDLEALFLPQGEDPFWDSHFNTFLVPFDNFYEILPSSTRNLKSFLELFCHSCPHMTKYRWKILQSYFGFAPDFLSNFWTYGCQPGFLGQISRLKVKLIFNAYPNEINLYAIRISNSDPDLLTFTFRYKNTSKIQNRRKPSDIPISDFVTQFFPQEKWTKIDYYDKIA